MTFEGEEPITYTVPRILEDSDIERIRERIEGRRSIRSDVKKYVLTGFIRCDECGKSLEGQTQHTPSGLLYQYYRHTAQGPCRAFCSVPLIPVENAVFRTIFENTVDQPAFEQAIAESLPDEKLVKSLEKQIIQGGKEVKRIDKELDKLVDIALAGTLKKETIKSKEESLLEAKATVREELEENKSRLRLMPDPSKVRQEAEVIRRQLLEHFSSQERLQSMSFDEKKQLLYWLFGGKDQEGKPYGIYVRKRGRGQGRKIDYFMYGRITGLRTLKGDDIDSQAWDEDDNNYKSNNIARK